VIPALAWRFPPNPFQLFVGEFGRLVWWAIGGWLLMFRLALFSVGIRFRCCGAVAQSRFLNFFLIGDLID